MGFEPAHDGVPSARCPRLCPLPKLVQLGPRRSHRLRRQPALVRARSLPPRVHHRSGRRGRLGAAPSLGKAAAPSPFLYGSRCSSSASGAARVTPSVGWTSPNLQPGGRLTLLASDYLAPKTKAPSATFSTASNPPATLNSALYLALYCVAGTTVVLGILDRTDTLTRSSTQSEFRAFDAMHRFSSPDTRGPVSFVLPILQPSHLEMTYPMLTSEPQRPLPPPTPRRPCPSASPLKNAAPSPFSPSLSCSA